MNDWKKELERILTEWEGSTNPVLGAFRVKSRLETLEQFISQEIERAERIGEERARKEIEQIVSEELDFAREHGEIA